MSIHIRFSYDMHYDSTSKFPWTGGVIPEVVDEAAVRDAIETAGGAQMEIHGWALMNDLKVDVHILPEVKKE